MLELSKSLDEFSKFKTSLKSYGNVFVNKLPRSDDAQASVRIRTWVIEALEKFSVCNNNTREALRHFFCIQDSDPLASIFVPILMDNPVIVPIEREPSASLSLKSPPSTRDTQADGRDSNANVKESSLLQEGKDEKVTIRGEEKDASLKPPDTNNNSNLSASSSSDATTSPRLNETDSNQKKISSAPPEETSSTLAPGISASNAEVKPDSKQEKDKSIAVASKETVSISAGAIEEEGPSKEETVCDPSPSVALNDAGESPAAFSVDPALSANRLSLHLAVTTLPGKAGVFTKARSIYQVFIIDFTYSSWILSHFEIIIIKISRLLLLYFFLFICVISAA